MVSTKIGITKIIKTRNYNGEYIYFELNLNGEIISVTEGFGFKRSPRINETYSNIIDEWFKITTKYGTVSFIQTIDEAINLKNEILKILKNESN